MRTRSRSPAKSLVDVRVVPGPQTAKQTVPTGLSGAPPSGPAMPVMDTASVDPQSFFAPSAISRAHGSLTAPKSASVSGLTPRTPVLISSEYDTTLPRKKTLAPDSDDTSCPARPPVHDSAMASVALRARSDL